MAAGCETCNGEGKAGLYTHHTCYSCSGSGNRRRGSTPTNLNQIRIEQHRRCEQKRQTLKHAHKILTEKLVHA